jgi:hypothetical protein
MVLGFPAVLVLASDHKDLLPGPGFTIPGHICGGDIALAAGCRPRQAQVGDPPLLHPAGAARGLAKEHEVFHHRTHRQAQPHVAGFVIVYGQIAHGIGGENHGNRGFICWRLAD